MFVTNFEDTWDESSTDQLPRASSSRSTAPPLLTQRPEVFVDVVMDLGLSLQDLSDDDSNSWAYFRMGIESQVCLFLCSRVS